MRLISLVAAGAFFLASIAPLAAAPATPVPGANATHITLVQEKNKETVGQKVKRAWRKLTNPSFTFCARCLLPPSATACTAQGKDRGEARSKCQARYQLCAITEDMRGCR
jgi:hypothetical protein